MSYVYLACGQGKKSEDLGEKLAQAALEPSLFIRERGGTVLSGLAKGAIMLTGNNGKRVPVTADPSWRDMHAVLDLVKRHPELALILKADSDRGDHQSAVILYRILDALNHEPETEDANIVFRKIFWADDDNHKSFPIEPEYLDIMAKGLARVCTSDAKLQAQAVARFKQLAVSGAWDRLYERRSHAFDGPLDMFNMLGNPNFTSAALEGGQIFLGRDPVSQQYALPRQIPRRTASPCPIQARNLAT
jgi:hypothetical protein